MNNKPEHTADISAELRTLSRSAEYCELQPKVFGKPIAWYFAELADRMDAAQMRERSELHEDVLSLQRTIVKLNNAIAELGERSCNMATMRHAIKTAISDLQSRLDMTNSVRQFMVRYLNAAIAEPPRNCDMFGGDAKMLHTAWFDWTGSPSGHNADGTVKLTYGEWLLVTATKGGEE